jgi:hypothetical protein
MSSLLPECSTDRIESGGRVTRERIDVRSLGSGELSGRGSFILHEPPIGVSSICEALVVAGSLLELSGSR